MSNAQNLDQRRAAHAWKAVDTFAKANVKEENMKKYGIHARKLPTRIIASGLGQALAFLLAKDYAPELLQALSHWVVDRTDYPADPKQLGAKDKLLRKVIEGNSDQLRLYTAEALAYLQWLVRFVEAQGITGEE